MFVLKHGEWTHSTITRKESWFPTLLVQTNKKSYGKGATASLGERSSPNTQMPPLCTTVVIQISVNNFMVTRIYRNKGNPPDSSTYDASDMNDILSGFW